MSRPTRILQKRIVVFCEGDTEYNYIIYDLILQIVLSKSKEITIARSVYLNNLVKSKFLKINYSQVEYVIDCLGKNTTKVHNIKSYLLTSLFNARSTISGYYKAKVNLTRMFLDMEYTGYRWLEDETI